MNNFFNLKTVLSIVLSVVLSVIIVSFLTKPNFYQSNPQYHRVDELENFILKIDRCTFSFENGGTKDVYFIITHETPKGEIIELDKKPIMLPPKGEKGYGVIYFKDENGSALNNPLRNMNKGKVFYTIFLRSAGSMSSFNGELKTAHLLDPGQAMSYGAHQNKDNKYPFLTIKNQKGILRFQIKQMD